MFADGCNLGQLHWPCILQQRYMYMPEWGWAQHFHVGKILKKILFVTKSIMFGKWEGGKKNTLIRRTPPSTPAFHLCDRYCLKSDHICKLLV